MNNTLTLGVVGHVDHGKTALVRALTGIETDRLREERERGLSIVLGFAFLEAENGVVDLIDVPGHENFVRAMIGGATALDGIVLCVAANEGVMPQTVEHFNIARLLGVDKGFVVITKSDAADDDMLELVSEDLKEFLRGSFLEGAPVIRVSVTSGTGLDETRAAVNELSSSLPEREATGQFFMPLDRVFTMRGFGLVATGTLRAGNLGVGDAVEILPARREATVRALQNHGQPVECAQPGQRVAVNLRNVSRNDVSRGDVLAAPGSLRATERVDAELQLLENASAVKNGTLVRVLTGTTEAMAKLRLLDRRALDPGVTAMVQLNLDRPIATKPGEHFLIRSYSPMHTIGGGKILKVDAKRHRRFDAAITEELTTVATGDIDLVVSQTLAGAGVRGVDPGELAGELGISKQRIEESDAVLDGVEIDGERIVAAKAYRALAEDIVAALRSFHNRHPYRNGVDSGSLLKLLESQPAEEVLRHALKDLAEQKRIQRTNELWSITGFDPFASLGDQDRQLAGQIEQAFLECGLEPPSPDALVGSGKTHQAVFGLLLEAGRLVQLRTYKSDTGLVLHSSVLANAKQAIAGKFPYPQPFALKDVRDLLGSTRKYIVPLMEHLDATGATVRNGDQRRLREA